MKNKKHKKRNEKKKTKKSQQENKQGIAKFPRKKTSFIDLCHTNI